MENAGDVDQFASQIIPNCQPTSSQEEKLQSCPFARESEEFSGMDSSSSTDEASEQATGIVMVTLPESSDDYQTPPEQQFYSQNSSNDSLVPATKTAAVDREKESGGVRDGEMMLAEDGYERKEKEMVDLTNDSDNLGLLEKSPAVRPEDDTTPMVDVNNNNRIESANRTDETVAENGVSEAPETPHKESADKVFVEMPMREQEASISDTEVITSLKSTDDINRKRRLPFSVNKPEKDDTEDDDDPNYDKFIDTLDLALKILRKEVQGDDSGNEDVDFLETAKRRGMTFPRPRWWPPEGETEFEDSNY